MAGWLKRVDGSFPEGNECCCEKLKSLFRNLLGECCLRPLPPRLGDGEPVDLLRLYSGVREKGGFDSVSKSGRWGCVARECGFCDIAGSAVKLVYVKYLGVLSEYLERVLEVRGSKIGVEVELSASECLVRLLMDLESDLKGCLSGTSPKKEKIVGFADVGFRKEMGFELNGKVRRFDEGTGLPDLNLCPAEIVERNDENASQVKRTNDPDTVLEEVDSRKRKQESYSKMLTWISRVALDPCNPGIGSLPESPKWKYFSDNLLWKQVLLARQAMQLKKENEMSDHQDATMKKKQKMHPFMYDDLSERQRYSQRIRAAKLTPRKTGAGIGFESSSSGTYSDDDPLETDSSGDSDPNFVANRRRKKRVCVGPGFQAEIPEWSGKADESDSKWLGTRVWPLEKYEQTRTIIERERIGKGRQSSCGCQFPGSLECIKFHVREKRMRIQLELGPAYYRMSFQFMGEEVSFSWAREEQKKFQSIVESNPLSLGRFFWHEIVRSFPSRDRKSLVSYYYNVFLLKRRGQQNRITPHDINSDDEDESLESKATTPFGSIFCSPNKVPGNAR